MKIKQFKQDKTTKSKTKTSKYNNKRWRKQNENKTKTTEYNNKSKLKQEQKKVQQ